MNLFLVKPQHTCPRCGQVVHVLCGRFDFELDKYVCNVDCRKMPSIHQTSINPPKPTHALLTSKQPMFFCQPASSTPQMGDVARIAIGSGTKSKIIMCSSCGGTDHQRKSSKKCKNFTVQPTTTSKQISTNKGKVMFKKSAEIQEKTTPQILNNRSHISSERCSFTAFLPSLVLCHAINSSF
jgi:hypothetical protein